MFKQEKKLRIIDRIIIDTETQLDEVKKIYDSVVDKDPSKSKTALYKLTQVNFRLEFV
jgi:hypothetical protein